jgi:hypothetical protein
MAVYGLNRYAAIGGARSALGRSRLRSQIVGWDRRLHAAWLAKLLRDWCGDIGDVPHDLAEAALAHSLNATEGAYRRMTAVERRREVTDDEIRRLAERRARQGPRLPYRQDRMSCSSMRLPSLGGRCSPLETFLFGNAVKHPKASIRKCISNPGLTRLCNRRRRLQSRLSRSSRRQRRETTRSKQFRGFGRPSP